jgi:hypothetical protein
VATLARDRGAWLDVGQLGAVATAGTTVARIRLEVRAGAATLVGRAAGAGAHTLVRSSGGGAELPGRTLHVAAAAGLLAGQAGLAAVLDIAAAVGIASRAGAGWTTHLPTWQVTIAGLTLVSLVQSWPQVPQLRGSVGVPQGPSGGDEAVSNGARSAAGSLAGAVAGASAGARPGASAPSKGAASVDDVTGSASVGWYLSGVAQASSEATRAQVRPTKRWVMGMILGRCRTGGGEVARAIEAGATAAGRRGTS